MFWCLQKVHTVFVDPKSMPTYTFLIINSFLFCYAFPREWSDQIVNRILSILLNIHKTYCSSHSTNSYVISFSLVWISNYKHRIGRSMQLLLPNNRQLFCIHVAVHLATITTYSRRLWINIRLYTHFLVWRRSTASNRNWQNALAYKIEVTIQRMKPDKPGEDRSPPCSWYSGCFHCPKRLQKQRQESE